MNRRIGAVSAISLLTLVLAGCPGIGPVGGGGDGDDPPPPPPPPVTVVPERIVPNPDGEIVLPPGQDDQIRPGAALVTGNGTRLLVVDDVEVLSDGSVQVTTSQGSVAQLGIEGEFRFAEPLSQPVSGKLSPQELALEANLQILQVSMPFSTTINLTNDGRVSAAVDGVFELDGLFHLAFDVGLFGGLRTFSSYVGGDASLTLDALVGAQISADISSEKPIGAPIKKFFAGFIGVVPIAVEVTAQLFVGFDGSVVADASIETGVDAHADVKVGAGYDSARSVSNRWSSIATSGFDWTYDGPIICANWSGSLRAYLRPHFEVQLYSVVGPTFDIEPWGRLDGSLQGCLGDPAVQYDATLTVGALGYAKIKADVLDRFVIESPRLTVFDVSSELASWHNTPLPTGACCATNRTCYVVLQSQCSGTYKGDNTTCTSGICPLSTGACCATNGTCSVVVQSQCSGMYKGDNTTCTAGSCQQPTGACCVNGNTCNMNVTQTSCTGLWQGPGATSCQNCSPTGADLVLTGFSVTRSSSSAQTFTGCSFSIINNGPTALSSEGIFVEYYLSDDTTFGDGDDRKIGDTGFTLSIASGATYPITLSSTGLSNMTRNWTAGLVSNGSYYVYAKVQISDGSPSDPTSANNYGRTSGTISYSEGDQSNSCQYAFDGECDDGRPGSITSLCAFGTDSADCD